MSRRVRRDSETSTDSWSLVEEDRLDDDFSLNSTDNEGAELDTEPIVEEPPTSDEEEDTASEKSLESDSEDSDSDDSDVSEDDVSEAPEGEEEVEEAIDSEDSDLSDAESDGSEALDVPENSDEESEDSEDSEDSEEDEEEEEEDEELSGEEMNDEEIAEAARKLKEDEKWIDEELAESESENSIRTFRAILICSLFFLLFPLADVFTSWMLTYRNHRSSRYEVDGIPGVYDIVHTENSLPRYFWEKNTNKVTEEITEDERDRRWVQMMLETGRRSRGRKSLHRLQDILEKDSEPIYEIVKESEIMDILNISSNDWKRQSDAPVTKTSNSQKIEFPWARRRAPVPTPADDYFEIPTYPSLYQQWLAYDRTWNSSIPSKSYRKPAAICKALAPVPPAPFTPRRVPKRQLPRHQPCFVHVNQSKWTCQKNLPSVIYQEPKFTVMPRVYKKKGMGRTSEKRKGEEIKWSDVCAKKASQSMRKIARPTDQCAGWLRNASPHERQSIAYKAPLPCKVPIYKPTIPKKSYKPSTPNDDWHHKRSQHRAQLRSRA